MAAEDGKHNITSLNLSYLTLNLNVKYFLN